MSSSREHREQLLIRIEEALVPGVDADLKGLLREAAEALAEEQGRCSVPTSVDDANGDREEWAAVLHSMATQVIEENHEAMAVIIADRDGVYHGMRDFTEGLGGRALMSEALRMGMAPVASQFVETFAKHVQLKTFESEETT